MHNLERLSTIAQERYELRVYDEAEVKGIAMRPPFEQQPKLFPDYPAFSRVGMPSDRESCSNESRRCIAVFRSNAFMM